MDRELSSDFLKQKRRKRWLKVGVPILVVIVGIYFGKGIIRPKVDLNQVAICIADSGPIERSFVSGGMIEPIYQEVLTSPISANIMQILHFPGDLISPEDTLIIPDVSLLEASLQEMDDQIALEKNRIERKQEELLQKETTLRSGLVMDSIKVEQLKAELENETYLFEIGGGSEQKVNQAQISYDLARINGENLIKEFNSFQKLQQLDIESMLLELSLKKQHRKKTQIKLNKAYIRPRINGVVTSVLVEPGQHVNEGQTLAHVANASDFKIEGNVSTRFADRIFIGQSSVIQVNDSLLSGTVSAISPSAASGTISFTVSLDNPKHHMLKAKLRVEVRMIQSKKEQAIRIKNGDFYFGPGFQDMFVKNGDVVEKRKVKLGGSNFDYVEVISGINEGETVIVSKSFNQQYEKYNSLQWVK